MKSLAFICVALLGVLCLVSCSNEGTPANPSQDIELEQAASESPPASSGPYVIRYDYQTWFLVYDERQGTMAIIGLDVWDVCSGVGDVEVISIMDITERNEQEAINSIFSGDNLSVSVWPILPVNCGLALEEPLAVGHVDMRGTDNDVFAWLHEDPKRMNSFGLTAHGRVETPGGDSGLVSIISRIVWRQNEGFYLINEKINMALVAGPNQ
jgi:hypothetical protein